MMINKEGLIFLTLTSLILVLSVYYLTMPNELLLTTNNSYLKEEKKEEVVNSEKVSIAESTVIDAMKSVLNDKRVEELGLLKDKLNDKTLSIEEKNNVYEEIKNMNKIEAMEEKIEELIKNELKLNSFVKVSDDVIEVTIGSNKHDTNLAVKIMSLIEKKYPNRYISISFKE